MRSRSFRKFAGKAVAVIIVATLTVGACTNPLDRDIVCSTEYVYGISATVTDAVTGANIASGSSLIVRDGAYVDSVAIPGFGLSAAGERPGTYTVTVRRAGYLPFTKTGVQVNKNVCHVIPVTVAAALQPAN